jgi:hypothetical protein
MEKDDVTYYLNFQNIFQRRKITWHEMMWHSYMLRKLKLMTCSGS